LRRNTFCHNNFLKTRRLRGTSINPGENPILIEITQTGETSRELNICTELVAFQRGGFDRAIWGRDNRTLEPSKTEDRNRN
jgi:hypothetical protein